MPRAQLAAAPPPAGKPHPGALKRYLIGQFGNPHGLMGVVAGRIMARRASNVRRNAWTVDLMALTPGDRVLEIGYGPGFALQLVCARLGGGQAVGLDRSATMARMAARRNREAIEAGRLKLLTGSVEAGALDAIPELAGPFDRIFAVNVAQFWTDPVAVLTRLQDRLSVGGRILLTLQPRGGDRSREGVMAAGGGIADQMWDAGLTDIEVDALKTITPMAVCVTGHKRA